jgi:hypothetical protein
VDFWSKFKLKKCDIHNILKEKYKVVISDKPDYIFFSKFGKKNKEIENKLDCIKIFVSVESTPSNFYSTYYAI